MSSPTSRINVARATRVIGALIAVGLLLPAAHRDTVSPFATSTYHERLGVYRNEDGSVKLNVRNELQSTNWSGYVLSNFATGQTYNSANVSWTVPQVSYQPLAPTCHTTHDKRSSSSRQLCFAQTADAEYSSSWVGIGGTCEDANCRTADNTLIQLGTEQDVADDGSTQYYAWYEMLPRNPVTISAPSSSTSHFCRSNSCGTPYPVQPGDAMTASLTCQTNCEPGQSQSWLLTMSDKTQKWSWSTTVTYASTLASVEWIQEAPTGSAGVLPLADFTPTSFDPTDDGGMIPNLPNGANDTVGPDGIAMIDPYGETSQPSPVVSLDAFSACWGNNPNNIAACPAP